LRRLASAKAGAVSRSYLDRVLSHQLALSVERGAPPPLGLLQVAETLGGVDWQPARMGETLARLIAEIPEAMRGEAIETVLRKSGELADLEAVAQSWFEDGPDIVQAIAGARARNRAKVVTYLLQSVIARHRDKWAELLLRTALVMKPKGTEPSGRAIMGRPDKSDPTPEPSAPKRHSLADLREAARRRREQQETAA
jgi:hypothetical protein